MRTREPPAARRAAERTTQRAPAAQSAPATAALAARRRIHLALLSARAPMSASIALRRHGRSAGRPTGGEPRLHALQSVHREVAPHAPERAPHPGRRDGPRRLPGAPEDLRSGGLGLWPQTRSAQPQRARLASICRPVELVRLRAAQEVVVGELQRVSVLDRLPDEDEPGAARLPVRIHARLVVIEAAPHLERVDGGDGLPTHPQAIETEPALRRQEGRHLAVEVLDGPARDAVRAPLRVPAQVMEAQEVPHGVGGLLGRGDDLDPIAGLPLQPAPAAQVPESAKPGQAKRGSTATLTPRAWSAPRKAAMVAVPQGRSSRSRKSQRCRLAATAWATAARTAAPKPGRRRRSGASVPRLQDPERPSLREGAPEGVLPLPGLEWVRRPASLVELVPLTAQRGEPGRVVRLHHPHRRERSVRGPARLDPHASSSTADAT